MSQEQEDLSENISISPETKLINFSEKVLGFSESDQMRGLREKLVNSDLKSPEGKKEFIRMMTEYQVKAQLGINVNSAAIYYSLGEMDSYNDSINDAIAYAEGVGYGDVVDGLKRIQVDVSEKNEG